MKQKPEKKPKLALLALKWGVFTGIGIIITHILLPQAGLLPCALWVYSDFVLLVFALILAQIVFKRKNKGYISLKCGFILGLLLSLFSGLFSRLYLWVELQFIDAGLLVHLCEELEFKLIQAGSHASEIEQFIKHKGPTAWRFVSFNFLLFISVGIVLSLIVSFLMQKKPPPSMIVYDHVERASTKKQK